MCDRQTAVVNNNYASNQPTQLGKTGICTMGTGVRVDQKKTNKKIKLEVSTTYPFSSVQDGTYAVRKARYAPAITLFSNCCLWNSSNFGLTDNGPFSSVQGRSLMATDWQWPLLVCSKEDHWGLLTDNGPFSPVQGRSLRATDWQWPFLICSMQSIESYPFQSLSPPGS